MDFTQQVSREIVTTVIAAEHRKPDVLSSLMMRGLEQIIFAYLILDITRNFFFCLNYPFVRSNKAITCDLAFFFFGKKRRANEKRNGGLFLSPPKEKEKKERLIVG